MTKYQKQIRPLALNVLITATLILSSLWGGAQPPPQGNGGGGGSTSGPIDGGAVVLLLGTAAYGYRQVKNRSVLRKPSHAAKANTVESI